MTITVLNTATTPFVGDGGRIIASGERDEVDETSPRIIEGLAAALRRTDRPATPTAGSTPSPVAAGEVSP